MGVAELCLARFEAEHVRKTPSPSGKPANTGSAVHAALENFVEFAFLEDNAAPDWNFLDDLYKIAYVEVFGSANYDTDEYRDGREMLWGWHKRTSFEGFEILSVETKESFQLPTPTGTVPFNYIWDRSDKLEEGVYRVVDYKTTWGFLNEEMLRRKIQARCYGLAAQIKWPDAKKIWVQFDLLRRDPIGVVFSRQDNIETWSFLKRAAKRIWNAPKPAPETLNSDCRYCVRKLICGTLNKHVGQGGVLGLSPEIAADRLLQIDGQIKALESIKEECDRILVSEAERRDELEWDVPGGRVRITASSRRSVRSDAVAEVLPQELVKKYGTFTVTNIDKLLKEPGLDQQTRDRVKAAIFKKWGEPTAKVEAVTASEEE